MVKFAHSASVAWGSLVYIPGMDGSTYCTSSHVVVASYIQKRGTDVSSVTLFLKQKEEDWQQISAQGQSSSQEKKNNTFKRDGLKIREKQNNQIFGSLRR